MIGAAQQHRRFDSIVYTIYSFNDSSRFFWFTANFSIRSQIYANRLCVQFVRSIRCVWLRTFNCVQSLKVEFSLKIIPWFCNCSNHIHKSATFYKWFKSKRKWFQMIKFPTIASSYRGQLSYIFFLFGYGFAFTSIFLLHEAETCSETFYPVVITLMNIRNLTMLMSNEKQIFELFHNYIINENNWKYSWE